MLEYLIFKENKKDYVNFPKFCMLWVNKKSQIQCLEWDSNTNVQIFLKQDKYSIEFIDAI